MSVLTDTDILKTLAKDDKQRHDHRIVINPFSEEALTPVGYDLRVGYFYKSNLDEMGITLKDGESIVLRPNSTTNIRTLEWVALPRDKTLSGFICSKVSLVSRGLSHVSTTVDPDWYGNLSISIHNHAPTSIKLTVGQTFCTMVLMQNASPATKDSGFAPARTDTLVVAITSDQKHKMMIRQRLKVAAIATGLLLIGGVLTVALFYASLPLAEDAKFHTAVMVGTVLGASLITGVISAVVVKLIFDR